MADKKPAPKKPKLGPAPKQEKVTSKYQPIKDPISR